ncbi:MAG: sel1 repeat family protein [Rhodospirillaceae bacterium]|nr:sel1 repeat family protein [Rhodospirillaceae bacterium]
MKYVRHFLFAPILAIAMGLSAHAWAESQNTSQGYTKLCPANPQFKSRVDEKLNSLSLEDLTAIADKGNAAAQVLLGIRYTSGEAPDLEKAVALFRKAAEKKDADAEYYMGVAYLSGMGVPKDEAQAVVWFKRSASRNHAVAQYWVGEMIAKGRGGLTADWAAALPYFEKAARGAVVTAIVEIGIMYHYGYGGLPVDYEKSASCYRVARSLGSQMAQYNIGLMVSDGKIQWQPGDPTKKVDALEAQPDSK